tara:strand:+ start:53 stop:1333 length:1281 start_codon:yes stop_codon:yes gene_type:complete
VQNLTTDNQAIVAQEMLFNKIFMLPTKADDYPMLSAKILDSYLFRKAVEHMRRFNSDREKKGNKAAILDLSDALDSLSDISISGDQIDFENIMEYAPAFLKNVEDIRSGKIEQDEAITCGISEIDRAMVVGFAPGTLTLFCGDVASGKSTMMLNVGLNIWKVRNKNVLFVPLEMPKELMFQKLLSRETEISFSRLQNPKIINDEEQKKMKAETESWDNVPGKFFIMKPGDRTKVSVIRREVEKHINMFDPDIVVVDYIANLLPDHPRRDRADIEIGDMLKDLRAMGDKLDFAVISGAQLGREALRRLRRQSGDQIVAYSEDLRGSHDYSADADFIFALIPDPQQPSSLLHLVTIKTRYGNKLFDNGRTKAALEWRPEISLIKSREDILQQVNQNEVLQRAQEDELSFDSDETQEKTKKDGEIDQLW